MSTTGNVAHGQAASFNHNNSEKAKERARERLDQMDTSSELGQEAHDAQVRTGHKAAINNPNVSQETKQHSRRVVEDEDWE